MENTARSVIVICNELPFPPNHGGRLDVWNQITALAAGGARICLICWYGKESDLPDDSTRSEIKKCVVELILLPVNKGLLGWFKRLSLLPSYPWFVSALLLKKSLYEKLTNNLQAFGPDLIFLVSIYGADLAGELSRNLKIPLVVRSQNIEHQYQNTLASQAITPQEKAKLYLSEIGLEQYERMVLSSCDWFFDISLDDLNYWKTRGLNNGEWLPTFIDVKSLSDRSDIPLAWDVVFLGNLNSPNNVQGVIWFCEQVAPMLRQSLPDIRILIAGSKPTLQVQDVCTKSGITLLPNPPSASDVYSSGKVLINIAPKGSGVSTKSIEMLMFGVPIVTTPQGVKGLPDSILQYFDTANTVEEFSEKVLAALDRELESNNSSVPVVALNHFFGDEAVTRFEERLAKVVAEYNKSGEERKRIPDYQTVKTDL